MSSVQTIHFAVELWGALFCVICIVSIYLTRSFDRTGGRKLILLFVMDALTLVCDAGAWFFRGNTSELGFVATRIFNFGALFCSYLVIAAVGNYIYYIIEKRAEVSMNYWRRSTYVICLIGIIILILSRLLEFMYGFDQNNEYVRLDYYWFPALVAVTALFIMIIAIISHFKKLYNREKTAILVYLSLPVAAIVVQYLHYGISYTYLAMTVSTIILFITYEMNYSYYMIEKEKKLNEERIRLLYNQIKPHFIFNSLGYIRHLCFENQEAVEAIDEFSAFLRGSIDILSETECIPFEKELETVKNYLNISNKRYEHMLNLEYRIEDSDFLIPPFALQVLVENALIHGIRSRVPVHGEIVIRSEFLNGEHIVCVEDDGVGFDPSKEIDNNHVGLRNLVSRLETMCGGRLEIESEPGKGTCAKIIIPEGGV